MRNLLAITALLAFVAGGAVAQTQTPPAPGPLRPYVFPQVNQFQLANGLKVIVVEKHNLPEVEGRLIIDAGAQREPAAKNGLASLTGRLLSEGTADLSGAEIASVLRCSEGVVKSMLFRSLRRLRKELMAVRHS